MCGIIPFNTQALIVATKFSHVTINKKKFSPKGKILEKTSYADKKRAEPDHQVYPGSPGTYPPGMRIAFKCSARCRGNFLHNLLRLPQAKKKALHSPTA